MKLVLTAALVAAGLAAFGARAGAEEMRIPVSLTSFGAAQATNPQPVSAAGLALGPTATFSHDAFSGDATPMPVVYGGRIAPQSFAASTALSINLAVDAGYNLDLTKRFDNYGASQSPLIDQSSFLGLANGGRYAGLTYAPAADLRLRLGAQLKSNRDDGYVYDPGLSIQNLPLTWDDGQQRSLLAGLSWDFAEWAGVSLSGIVNEQKGPPLGASLYAGIAPAAVTSALNVAAHVNFGAGWVTTAAFSDGLTQLDQKTAEPTSLDGNSYSFTIAKHGVFGQDALGFSFSRPSTGLLDNGFDSVAASGDLPPVFVANTKLPDVTAETDLQLGYVTSFGTAVELQANAAYQMNYQGQTGTTSLAVLSRAKIKF
jgi:hypothetical protein